MRKINFYGTILKSASIFSDYLSLMKPRLAMLNVIAATSGILMTRKLGNFSYHLESIFYISTLIAGAAALNCVWEADGDKLMERTKDRAIATGRISIAAGLFFGLLLTVIGLVGLYLRVNLLTFVLGVVSVISYVLVYTPLKRKTYLAVYAGAIPGALPPVLGYTSIINSLDLMAISLFAILFFWQIPHFLAISIYQSVDYEKGGVLVYPNVKSIKTTRFVMIFFAVLTCVSGVIPYFLGQSGLVFLILGLVSGLYFVYMNSTNISHILDKKPELDKWAKKCFFASIIYLPVLFGLMIVF